MAWRVHKFGGTSVANAECLMNVKSIIEDHLLRADLSLAVVVSAMGGKPKVTDMLLDVVSAAAAHESEKMGALLGQIRKKHFDALEGLELLPVEVREQIRRQIERDLEDVGNLLRAVGVMRASTPQIAELVSGFGETWSARILTALLVAAGHEFAYVDARDVLSVECGDARGDRCGAVVWSDSQRKLDALVSRHGGCSSSGRPLQLVITGYIASTVDGAPTTLKRDGSDYSASIFGKLLSAAEVHIWTDVDGVLSADPRRVPEAFSLEEVTYEEAMELAYFGAKVLHPKTMTPCVEANIPLYIRNTFNPTGRGTRIGSSKELARKSMMAGFTTVDDVAVINVCGTGMLGVPGVVFTAAGALRNAQVSVRLIAQSSSEMSIALAIDAKRADEAKKALDEAYDRQLRSGEIAAVEIVKPCAIIAAVAQSLTTDAPGRFYDSLGRCGIPLVASAQGCDERNLSAVVHARDARRALRAVHSAFLGHNVVALALIGAGFNGGHLLDAIAEAERMLLARFNVKLRVCALVNADVMVLAEPDETQTTTTTTTTTTEGGEGDIDLTNWRSRLKTATTESDFDALVAHLERYRAWVPNLVVVDTSYSLAVAEQHSTWLRHQFHVINANTRALAGPLDLFEQILKARDAAGPICYLSEACVGGGLPVIDTLRNLVLGGDTVRHVECVISASMSFIFSLVSTAALATAKNGHAPTKNGHAFSKNGHGRPLNDDDADPPKPVRFRDAVKRAWVMGLLENEPFLDISGQDAATKLLALGRELGLALEPQHIRSEPVDGLREILAAENTDPQQPNVESFRQQYLSWRRGLRSLGDCDVCGDEDAAEHWLPPETHERAVAIAGGEIASAPSPSSERVSKPPRGQHARLFGWSAVESYDARSLDEGYSRAEASGRVLPISEKTLDAIDEAVHARVEAAHANGKVLRYVGRIDVATGDVEVKLEDVDPSHAFAQLSGPELCVRFFTERYRAIPLTVNGPLFAAGMASGVFSELLRVVRHCSGHDRPYHLQLRRTRSMSRLESF
ncbi:hypothetical protein CTAYLR_006404 [Chrysophaeum taylorii]|uniref:ACT domain-containing protein n=1 Tax=Chrysophaeum taylorii TaxID=2483200 RepID=A0AAD7XJN7_9STRA|nr:hypothetical protein CTAYLR_006404 [Chrysophaeum taylorii]